MKVIYDQQFWNRHTKLLHWLRQDPGVTTCPDFLLEKFTQSQHTHKFKSKCLWGHTRFTFYYTSRQLFLRVQLIWAAVIETESKWVKGMKIQAEYEGRTGPVCSQAHSNGEQTPKHIISTHTIMVCEMNTESSTYNRNYWHLTTEQPLFTPPIGYMLIHALFPTL